MIVACGLAAIFLETWLVAGLFRPVIVASGSMAPRLPGPHRAWTCTDCGSTFVCGLESLPTPRRAAVCPYCQTANDPDRGVDRPGARVLVDRWTYAWRAPRRWEMVVLRCPESPRDWCVKRIVGLPGEHVEIRDGDVWIDGQIARKTVSEARRMALLVYKPAKPTRTGDDPSDRWTDPTGIWRRKNLHYVHQADDDAEHSRQIHWLEYHHPRRSTPSDRSHDGPILDESPYDQSESRQLNPVGDLLARGRIVCGEQGELFLRARRGPDEFLVRLDIAAGTGTLEHNDRVVQAITAAKIPAGRPVQLEWMLADRQLQLAIDGRSLVVHRYRPRRDDPAIDDEGPGLAIGARGADIRLEQLTVYRDLYYTPPRRSDRRQSRLGPDEYFLLGDNSPHSMDSRSWPRAGASASQMVGRVVRW